jgi:hypothetical protein
MIAHHIQPCAWLDSRAGLGGNLTPMSQPSILSVLRNRVGLQPVDN